MYEIVAAAAPWFVAACGFVALNWFAVRQIEKRFYQIMEQQNDQRRRASEAAKALRDARRASRMDRIDRML